ncbi:hypothetical protein FQN54_005434 [Arachnomyces sp. PD_36]|nr:hypothetical protein FQN54_005434 [Arachnomyces sp. PD_36]
MRIQAALLLLASSVLPSSLAIFVDEAYHIDYQHALFGIPQAPSTFFHRPSSSSNASLLYTISEKNIVGAVKPKDGSIVWRQDLSRSSAGSKSFLRAVDGESNVISAVGGEVAAWAASDGKQVWGNRFDSGPVVDLELAELGQDQATSDPIVLSGEKNGVVRRLDAASGNVRWEYKDVSGDEPLQVSSSSSEVYYVSLQSAFLGGYKIKVTALDPSTGHSGKQHILSSENEVSGPGSVLFVGANTASPVIAWTDKAKKSLKLNIIGSKQVHTLNIDNDSGEDITTVDIQAPQNPSSAPHFLVHYETQSKSWAEVYHIDVKSATVSKAYALPAMREKSTFAASNVGSGVYFTRITDASISVTSSESEEIIGIWMLKRAKLDGTRHATAEVVSRGTSLAVRFAHVLESGDWELVRNGEPEWSRPEELAGVLAASWAEPDGGEELAHELEVEGHQSLYGAYIHRATRHLRDLQNLPTWLQGLPPRILSSFLSNEIDLAGFGFAKLVIVATENGRIIGLDSGKRGEVVWNVKATDNIEEWGVISITAEHGIATVFLSDGSHVKVKVLTGEITERGAPTQKLGSVILLPSSSKAVGVLENGTPTELSEIGEVGAIIVTRSDDGRVLGWGPGSSKSPVWEFRPPHGQKIVGTTARPSHDPVASIGKVLGNRSVLYKYLNPNLALITAVTDTMAVFYLIDAVSGQVLHTSTQTGVDTTQPIASVMSENWLAYSFYSDVTSTSDSKGYKLVISELYESLIPNDRGPLDAATNFSSIHNAGIPLPHVISQSFIIPEPISHMSVTQTRQGITTRQLLCSLPETNSIIGIPRSILDPRRPVDRDPLPTEAEEGLFRYNPVLDFDPRWYLTHAREVLGIKAILSSATLLESSSLVFAYGGVDVFGTRVAPSGTFDILGKEFSKVQLVATVLALGVGVSVLAPMVRRKQVDARWK